MVCRGARQKQRWSVIKSIETKQAGFLLMQMVVYLALTALCMLYTMQWIAATVLQGSAVMKKTIAAYTVSAATDVWMRDMRAILGPLHYQDTAWIWQKGVAHVRWYLVDSRLIRSEGIYKDGIWQARAQSLMAENVTKVTMTHHKAQRLAHLTIRVQPIPTDDTSSIDVERTVFLCNGLWQ